MNGILKTCFTCSWQEIVRATVWNSAGNKEASACPWSQRNERKTVAKLRLRRYIEVLAQQAHPSTGEAPCWTSVTKELSHGSHFGRALVDVAVRCYKCQCCCVNCKSYLKSQMSHGQQIDSLPATSSEKLWGAGSEKIAAHVDRQNGQNRSPLLFSDLRDSGLRCARYWWPRRASSFGRAKAGFFWSCWRQSSARSAARRV